MHHKGMADESLHCIYAAWMALQHTAWALAVSMQCLECLILYCLNGVIGRQGIPFTLGESCIITLHCVRLLHELYLLVWSAGSGQARHGGLQSVEEDPHASREPWTLTRHQGWGQVRQSWGAGHPGAAHTDPERHLEVSLKPPPHFSEPLVTISFSMMH